MAIDDELYKKIETTEEELAAMPLCMKNILRIDYIDTDVPYKVMYNPSVNGKLFGQHSTRNISLMLDYSLVFKFLKDA